MEIMGFHYKKFGLSQRAKGFVKGFDNARLHVVDTPIAKSLETFRTTHNVCCPRKIAMCKMRYERFLTTRALHVVDTHVFKRLETFRNTQCVLS